MQILIYIYIYISRDLMQESMRFCCMAHFLKRIEIPLSHVKDKNKFKNRDSLFPLAQCFETIFVTLFIQCFKTTICFIWFNISILFISHTHKKFFAFLFTLFTSTPSYTRSQLFISSHLKYTQTKNDVIGYDQGRGLTFFIQ